MSWRYLAYKLNGDGTETLLSNDVPLQGAVLREDLSGPGGIDGSISPEVARFKTTGGDPVFLPWSTAIYAEKDGNLRAGAILADLLEDGPTLSLDTVGFSGYPKDQPYTGDKSWIQEDPLNIVRHIWSHLQGKKGGNLGLTVAGTTSSVRIGAKEEDVSFTTGNGEEVSFSAGPYTLQWWKDHDLSKVLDDLALETPFDYLVDHDWNGDAIRHTLRLGYPEIGSRRHDLRFMLGENVFDELPIRYEGDAYASEVIALGAGEGRKMVRGGDARVTGRLHRATVVVDKTLRNKKSADSVARLELAGRIGDEDLDTLIVREHPHAALGTFRPGDEILVQSPGGLTKDVYLWVRILSVATEAEKNQATLTVARTDRMG
ncbi:hypothetical protein ACFVRV_06105 [Arthrobacter koreensis]|uniref:hypothetical protein n=1 Tax=Arthrobacter koreensis TaxID=199136 RepID=UPI0036D9923C